MRNEPQPSKPYPGGAVLPEDRWPTKRSLAIALTAIAGLLVVGALEWEFWTDPQISPILALGLTGGVIACLAVAVWGLASDEEQG